MSETTPDGPTGGLYYEAEALNDNDLEGNEAVVMVSGGIDSAVCTMLALENFDSVKPVHVQYGQQTADVELYNARQMVQWAHQRSEQVDDYADYVAELSVVNYKPVFGHFAGGVADPDKDFEHLTEEDGRSAGYVPMRNIHLISTGSAFADKRDADAVILGPQAGDEADYPDCREEFLEAANNAINEAIPADQEINVHYPLVHKSKVEVIQTGEEYGVPWEFTYSCYEEVDIDVKDGKPEPCGKCPACLERTEAFEAAGVDDPYMV